MLTKRFCIGIIALALGVFVLLTNELSAQNNRATGFGAYIGGGARNTASGRLSSILGGYNNTASGPNTSILGGHTNVVAGRRGGILAGTQNTVTTAGRQGAIISGVQNVVGGINGGVGFGFMNTVQGTYGVILAGRENLVTGNRSAIVAGKRSTLSADDSLLFGSDINYTGVDAGVVYLGDDSRAGTLDQDFDSNEMICRFDNGLRFYADPTSSDVNFRIDPDGRVGIGDATPSVPLDVFTNGTQASHFTSQGNTNNTVATHVVHIQSTRADNSAVLALQVGDNTPSAADNWITFFDNNGDPRGRVEANASSNAVFVTGGNDFAEVLPLADSAQAKKPAEIVPVHAGEIGNWANADHFMVISNQAGFVGNDPGEEAEGKGGYHHIAFLGQVPVKVHGSVDAGDYIIASDRNDGTGIARPAEKIDVAEMYRVVGRAWESSSEEGLKEVNTAVGLDQTTLIVPALVRLERENEELRARVAELEAREKTREARFARLEAAIRAGSTLPFHTSLDLAASTR